MIQAATPAPRRPFRLTKIPSIARRKLPAVYVGDEQFAVDSTGLVAIGRAYPIRGVPSPTEVGLAGQWLEEAIAIKGCKVSSYKLKHIAERWGGGYCSNGAFILAAHLAGFNLEHRGNGSPNVMVGVSVKWLKTRPEAARSGFYKYTLDRTIRGIQ